jgi:hypothetical protein
MPPQNENKFGLYFLYSTIALLVVGAGFLYFVYMGQNSGQDKRAEQDEVIGSIKISSTTPDEDKLKVLNALKETSTSTDADKLKLLEQLRTESINTDASDKTNPVNSPQTTMSDSEKLKLLEQLRNN